MIAIAGLSGSWGLACSSGDSSPGGESSSPSWSGGAEKDSSASTNDGGDSSASTNDGGDSSSTSSSSGTPADPKKTTCEAYADLIVNCCNPPAAQCGADRRSGWVDFCMKGYDSCKAAYDCLATATCATRDSCPNVGSGCK